jgi:hypothetical protein
MSDPRSEPTMPDFFTRLAERTLGQATVLQPAIAPRFATPEPSTVDLSVEEVWRSPEAPTQPRPTQSPPRSQEVSPPDQTPDTLSDHSTPISPPPTPPIPVPLPFVEAPQPQALLRPSDSTTPQREPLFPQLIEPESPVLSNDPQPLVTLVLLADRTPQQPRDLANSNSTAQVVPQAARPSPESLSRRSPLDLASPTAPTPPPRIQIHIDRIDVRAVSAPAAASLPRSTGPAPKLTLDDYLRQRNGGSS